jgi:hypothetical protein
MFPNNSEVFLLFQLNVRSIKYGHLFWDTAILLRYGH